MHVFWPHRFHEQWKRLIRAMNVPERLGNNSESLLQLHVASLWNGSCVCPFARPYSCLSKSRTGIRFPNSNNQFSVASASHDQRLSRLTPQIKIVGVGGDGKQSILGIEQERAGLFARKLSDEDGNHASLMITYPFLNEGNVLSCR